MTTLPRQLNYERPSSLPVGTRSTQVVINPNNGSKFDSAGSVIQFDLLNKGFIVPTSLSLSYKFKLTPTDNTIDYVMRGVPAVSPFQRLETIHNGNVIESVNQYNSLFNMLVNTKLSAGQKLSLTPALGYDADIDTATTDNDGRAVTAATETSMSFAFPVGGLIANCDHLFPAAYCGSLRLQLTLDDVVNYINTTAGVAYAGAFEISDLTLKYDCVEFPSEVDAMVLGSLADENGSIHIKSQTFQTSSQTLPSGTSGQQSLIFNTRLSSIKSLVAAFEGGKATQTNGKFDALNVANTYQYGLNGAYYPQRPLDTQNDLAGCFLELNSTWSQPHDVLSTSMSISTAQYAKGEDDATAQISSGKHYVGVNVENMSGASGTLFSGISSQLAPINLNLNVGTATANTHNCSLYVCHDAIISVNVATRELFVKQ